MQVRWLIGSAPWRRTRVNHGIYGNFKAPGHGHGWRACAGPKPFMQSMPRRLRRQMHLSKKAGLSPADSIFWPELIPWPRPPQRGMRNSPLPNEQRGRNATPPAPSCCLPRPGRLVSSYPPAGLPYSVKVQSSNPCVVVLIFRDSWPRIETQPPLMAMNTLRPSSRRNVLLPHGSPAIANLLAAPRI